MRSFVRLFLGLYSLAASALVPVEGLLLGEADPALQVDPLAQVFQQSAPGEAPADASVMKLYHNRYLKSVDLVESCSVLKASPYGSSWQEAQAKRTVAANLQFLGLDLSIKAIGAYARKLEVPPAEFETLGQNLVKNYCSPNVTVMSLRNISRALRHYYENPEPGLIPSIDEASFGTNTLRRTTSSSLARNREFDLALKSFRSFCSWGSDVDDYRLLGPYLKHPLIFSTLQRFMSGVTLSFNPTTKQVETVPARDGVRVSCRELICRPGDAQTFTASFPLSLGATGLETDLSRLYCNHFRYQDLQMTRTHPQVSKWLKASELEEPIFETNFFVSLFTGVPDLFFGARTYRDVPLLVRSTADERWNKWSYDVLSAFSSDLLFEESLKVRVRPLRSVARLAQEGFQLDFSVTLGEIDRLLNDNDKIHMSFELKLSKNWLRELRTRWDYLTRNVETEDQQRFRAEIAAYVEKNLRDKEKLFRQKLWNDDFARLLSDELLAQALTYRGPLFDSLKDEMLSVPVRFSYGVFALSYMRYRADLVSGQLVKTL